jgi:hypothetical protein
MTDERTVRGGAEGARSTAIAEAGAARDLAASRRRVEEHLETLRRAVRERTGFDLGRRPWALPLVAAALGFSLALLVRRGRR